MIPARHGETWSYTEDLQLMKLIRSHKSLAEICRAHQRTPTGIESRLARLVAKYVQWEAQSTTAMPPFSFREQVLWAQAQPPGFSKKCVSVFHSGSPVEFNMDPKTNAAEEAVPALDAKFFLLYDIDKRVTVGTPFATRKEADEAADKIVHGCPTRRIALLEAKELFTVGETVRTPMKAAR